MRARSIKQDKRNLKPQYKICIIPVEYTVRHERGYCNTAEDAARFVAPKHVPHWKLYINGRLYDWPKDQPGNRHEVLRKHIEYCLDLDESFYEEDDS